MNKLSLAVCITLLTACSADGLDLAVDGGAADLARNGTDLVSESAENTHETACGLRPITAACQPTKPCDKRPTACYLCNTCSTGAGEKSWDRGAVCWERPATDGDFYQCVKSCDECLSD